MGFKDYPSLGELKKRYHTMAQDLHPDKPNGSEPRFKMLLQSYQHLSTVCV
jgi:DnaJ-class molecular chaperone